MSFISALMYIFVYILCRFKVINLPKKKIEFNGQIKIRPHLPKFINPVQRYLNLKVLQTSHFFREWLTTNENNVI